MKVCNSCGTACKDDAQFCIGCGRTFTTSTTFEYSQTQYANNQGPAQTNEYRVVIETPVRIPTQLSETDKTLRLIAFILECISLPAAFFLFGIPLAWMIPMTIVTWGIYKGTRRNTVAFGVCTLIFVNPVAGILLLCSQKDE